MIAALKNSIIITALFRFFSRWIDDWCSGIVGAFFRRFGAAIKNSAVILKLRQTGNMDKAWSDSYFCKAVKAFCNAPIKLFEIIGRKHAGLLNDSAIASYIKSLSDKSYLLLGVVYAVIIIIPHDFWNNAYAFAIMLILLFVSGISFAMTDKRFKAERIGPFLPLFFIITVYSFIASINIALSFRFVLFYITAAITLLLSVSCAENSRQITKMLTVILAGVTITSLFACYQRIAGIEVLASQVDLSLDLNQGMPGRVYGTFENPNNLAELFVLTMPFYMAVYFNARTKSRKRFVLYAAIPPVIAMAMTYSRSGWIGLVLAVLIFAFFKKRRVVPVIIIVGLLALPVLPRSILNRILTIGSRKDSSTNYRFMIYDSLSGLLKDIWARGIGLGSDVMSIAVKTYKQMLNGRYPLHAHNNYIQLVVEMGILGAVSYIAAMLNIIKNSFKTAVKRIDDSTRNIILAGAVSLIGIMIISLAEYTWFYPRVMLIFWLTTGITIASYRMGLTTTEINNER